MTSSDPGQPSLEDTAPQPDPNPPVDYPADAGLPPTWRVTPNYPRYQPGAYDPYWPTKPRGTNSKAMIGGLVVAG